MLRLCLMSCGCVYVVLMCIGSVPRVRGLQMLFVFDVFVSALFCLF